MCMQMLHKGILHTGTILSKPRRATPSSCCGHCISRADFEDAYMMVCDFLQAPFSSLLVVSFLSFSSVESFDSADNLGKLGVFPLCSRTASALPGPSMNFPHFFSVFGCISRGGLLQGERLAGSRCVFWGGYTQWQHLMPLFEHRRFSFFLGSYFSFDSANLALSFMFSLSGRCRRLSFGVFHSQTVSAQYPGPLALKQRLHSLCG